MDVHTYPERWTQNTLGWIELNFKIMAKEEFNGAQMGSKPHSNAHMKDDNDIQVIMSCTHPMMWTNISFYNSSFFANQESN